MDRVSRAEYATSESGFHANSRQWKTETVTTYQYDGMGMNVLREYRDTDYAPSLGFPWLPWFGGMGMRPKWGPRLGWPGSRWWDRVPSGKYRPMSEYLFGNEVESRTDWDPDQPHLTWKDTEYYHQDILGSVAALTDRYGVVRERYKYDAFGNQYEGSFQRINELGYNGKRYDGATGWYDYGFRDYEAEVGRFTTVDPIRDGGNWYVYVGNDPVNWTDPWGLDHLYANYTKGSGTLTATYIPTTSSGSIEYYNIKTYTWNVSNNVRNEINDDFVRDDPDVKTFPADGSQNQWYYPRNFPTGTWDIEKSIPKQGSPEIGTVFIPTTAQQQVPVYGPGNQDMPLADENGQYTPTGTQVDSAYGLHAGVGNTTLGCLKFSSQADANAFATLSDKALDSQNGTSQITVRCGD